MIKAADLVRSARRRVHLTQRELSRRAGIPQPTIAAIESGRQDPRYSTLVALLAACGYELGYERRAGEGVDQSLIRAELRRTPLERLRQIPAEAAFLDKVDRAARR